MLLRVLTLSCFLFLVVFSIGSAFAATTSSGETVPETVPATYIPKAYQDTPVSCSIASITLGNLTSSACYQAIRSYKIAAACKNDQGENITCYLVFSSFVTEPPFTPGLSASGSAVYCPSGGAAVCQTLYFGYSGTQAVYSESYTCPPVGYPEHIIHSLDGRSCSIKVCSKDQTKVFDGVDMPNGAGYACSAGCEVQTYKPSTSAGQFGWQFIGVSTGAVCKCVDSATGQPSKSLNCWYRGYSPDGSGSSSDDKTCTAFDAGELHHVNCGENGEMTVDLGPVNDSLVAISQTNTAQDKVLNEHSVQLANHDIALNTINSRIESGALKGEKGDKGDPGEKGEKGDQGDKGGVGAAGAQGLQGEKGEKGDAGEAGAAGAAGLKGEKGDKGDKGDTGLSGSDGSNGVDGINGVDGEKGEDGDSVLAVQDGINVRMVSSKTGATMATLEGIDKDGIITAVDKSTQAITDLSDMLNISAPSDSENPYSDLFGESSLSALDSQIAQVKTDITDLINQAGDKLNIGSISGGGSYVTDVHEIKGQSVDLSGAGLFDMLVANGAATVVSLIFSLLGFGVLLGGSKK